MSIAAFGWILLILGIVAIIFGLIGGARDLFQRQNEGQAQATLPTEFLKVLGKLIEAPTHKMFFGGGILLVVIGAILTGADVFTPADTASNTAP